MSSEATLVLALFIPLLSAFFIAANDERPDWREGVTLLASVLLLGVVMGFIWASFQSVQDQVDHVTGEVTSAAAASSYALPLRSSAIARHRRTW